MHVEAQRPAGPPASAPRAGESVYALLADGGTVEIRAAEQDDAEAVRQMHAALSPGNLYLRFFSLSPHSAQREAQRVCRAPDARHGALLAWLDGRLAGVASYELAGDARTAEIAFAVPDDLHHRGIGTLLLEHLVSLARRRGLTAFTATTLAENAAMLRVFSDAGLPVRRSVDGGEVQLTFPLPGDDSDLALETYLDAVASRESRAGVASLQHLLRPRSVAVIGAGRDRSSVGRAILHNIVAGGFGGLVYAVNLHAHRIEGVPCAASVADLPEVPELAVIAVPAAAVARVAADCGTAGVRALIVITSGLGTAGADLLAICRRHGMRLVGPNCLGIMVPGTGLNATFAAHPAAPGAAGLAVQSGGVGIALLEQLSRLGVGVSSFASIGDKYDVSSNDLLTWWEQDEATRLAVLYVESFGNPRKFARTARRVGRRMPVLTVIGGRSSAGQSAAASHTAAAATPLVTQEALFGQAGIIATRSLGELIDAAALLACQPLPAGPRVAVLSNAGGAGVLAADAAQDSGLTMAGLSPDTRRRLRALLPAGAAVGGPIDTTAAVTSPAFQTALEIVAADDGVDAVLALAVPTALGDLTAAISAAATGKPVLAVLLDQSESARLLPRATSDDRLPAYAYPEAAARALGHAARYRAWRDRPGSRVPALSGVRTPDARQLTAAFLSASPAGGWLPASQVAELLACYEIPLAATVRVASEEEALQAAARLGGRIVLKAEAAGLIHKSEAGAVKLDLATPEEIAGGYRDLAARFGRDLRRVLVQPMLASGVETLVGVVQEPVFGPLVVFGLGGVSTDVLGDRSARLAPLTRADAGDMIADLRAAPLLLGHRGARAADTGALADILLRVSRLADDLPEVAELDLNPVIARPDGACAVDARVRLSATEHRDPFLRRLR
ncbi:MAG TPA: bifunctional GNAT family N-acetyltransferase/acetate--CoA ligase family protein [Streptosporangiaceae bacterium]|nr:bifunctional GNAT family N-acetyltransferase/acetate--CoA ligase family protein [Streptosporangiaceae bacterium]